jgi:hypothetical protein
MVVKFYSNLIGHNIFRVQILLFLMCFVTFFELNEFIEKF